MDGGFKAYVRLGDVRPSDANPRKDFGDIDALARSLEATGGEPVNPIVLVRDGNVYRIVDGERRYRALCKIHGEDERVGALVFNDYTEASSVVAMLATDDKMRLSPEEQAVGFQTMLTLGVDEEVTAKAVGRDVEQVRRARRSLGAAKGAVQTSLDVLILAGDDEFDDYERAEILSAGSTEQGDYALTSAKIMASNFRDKHKTRKKLDGLRLAMPDCIEYHDEPKPYADDGPRLTYVCEVKSVKDARELEPEDGVDYHAYHASYGGKTWSVYRVAADGEEERNKHEAELAAQREERDRCLRLMQTMRYSMMEFVLDALRDGAMEGLPATCAKVMESRKVPADGELYDMDVLCVEREGDLDACEPSAYEVFAWVHARIGGTNNWYGTPFTQYSSARATVAETWDALVADGWQPTKDILEVREACGKVKE